MKRALKVVISLSAFVAASCATTSGGEGGAGSDGLTTLSGDSSSATVVCQYGKDLASLESLKDAISNSIDGQATVLTLKPQILALAEKAGAPSVDARSEDRLGCSLLETEARALLVELPAQDGELDPYKLAQDAADATVAMCGPQSDARMCSAARLHANTLFARRSAAELSRIAAGDAATPVDWDKTIAVTEALEEHIASKWATALSEESTDVSAPGAGEDSLGMMSLDRSLMAATCAADKAATAINRRVGLSVNRGADGKLVPYGRYSGEMLAQAAIALDLSPQEAGCYATPEEPACRDSLASKVHLMCLRASSSQ